MDEDFCVRMPALACPLTGNRAVQVHAAALVIECCQCGLSQFIQSIFIYHKLLYFLAGLHSICSRLGQLAEVEYPAHLSGPRRRRFAQRLAFPYKCAFLIDLHGPASVFRFQSQCLLLFRIKSDLIDPDAVCLRVTRAHNRSRNCANEHSFEFHSRIIKILRAFWFVKLTKIQIIFARYTF